MSIRQYIIVFSVTFTFGPQNQSNNKELAMLRFSFYVNEWISDAHLFDLSEVKSVFFSLKYVIQMHKHAHN